MAEKLWVDKTKLRAGAATVDTAADEVDASVGRMVNRYLALAEEALPGSVTSGTLPGMARAVTEAAADMVAGMRGLSQGLEAAANRFHTVDVVLGEAASPDVPRKPF